MKTRFILITFFLIGTFLSCSSQKSASDLVKMEQIETELPISLLGDTVNNIIVRCHLPFAFKISSSSWKSQYVQTFKYYYCKDYGKKYYGKYHGDWNGSFIISQYINGELLDSSSQRLIDKKMLIFLSQEFIIQPSFEFDTCQQTQNELKEYLDEMKKMRVNKLSSITFKKFKENHPELTKTLLEGDSIRVIGYPDSKPYDDSKIFEMISSIQY